MPRQSPHTERLLDIEQLGERIHRSRDWITRNWRGYACLRRNVVRHGMKLLWPDDVVAKYCDEQRRRNRQGPVGTPKRMERKAVSS